MRHFSHRPQTGTEPFGGNRAENDDLLHIPDLYLVSAASLRAVVTSGAIERSEPSSRVLKNYLRCLYGVEIDPLRRPGERPPREKYSFTACRPGGRSRRFSADFSLQSPPH